MIQIDGKNNLLYEHWNLSHYIYVTRATVIEVFQNVKVDENPHFALSIDRSSDVCITLSQTDKGVAVGEPVRM